ncbi:MAG: site-specific DNA-methyltransferase [bacterium]|nr:site-specific DNA-methyltransferase [bacterium]
MAKSNKYDNYTKDELIDELETLKKKKYGLVWDKKNSQEILDAFVNWENVPENFVPKQFPVLKEVKNKEIKTDKTKPANLLIEGDNYHSLAVLNFTHQDKVGCIYIDPPYNTGSKDFFFNDKFIDKDDPWRHSKWLSFMEKRLLLAKNLLNKDGVMFISIDDNEFAPLKMLCDEIFGQDQVDVFIWRKSGDGRYGKMKNTTTFRKDPEYIIVCYRDEKKLNKIKEIPQFQNEYDNPDNDHRGPYKAGSISRREDASNPEHKNYYEVTSPSGKKVKRQFDIPKKDFIALNNDRRIYWGKNGDAVPSIKIFIREEREITPYSVLLAKGTTTEGTEELNEILGGDFSALRPKPSLLIKTLVQLGSKTDSIVLDFFAGSGTTGQAVMQLNKDDNGNRRFILCTNNAEINNNGEAVKHKICTDICYPRIEKIINGYKDADNKKILGLGGSLKYFKTDFVGSDPNDKNKRDLVKQSTEMICIKEDIFDLVIDEGFDFKIYQKEKKFLGVVFDIGSLEAFKQTAEKCNGDFSVYCFSYNEATPEKEFKNLNNKYTFKPIPAVILKVYLEIFKK